MISKSIRGSRIGARRGEDSQGKVSKKPRAIHWTLRVATPCAKIPVVIGASREHLTLDASSVMRPNLRPLARLPKPATSSAHVETT
jgi:hypothetical protein